MECNRDEARRAKEVAERAFEGNDVAKSQKFAKLAQRLYPNLEGIDHMVAALEVHVAAENKLGSSQLKDWYAILQSPPFSDISSVRKKYHRLALELHPDKNKSALAEGAFKLIANAWFFLSDLVRKSGYDDKRRSLHLPCDSPHASAMVIPNSAVVSKGPNSTVVSKGTKEFGIQGFGVTKWDSSHGNSSSNCKRPPSAEFAKKDCGSDHGNSKDSGYDKEDSASDNGNAKKDSDDGYAKTDSGSDNGNVKKDIGCDNSSGKKDIGCDNGNGKKGSGSDHGNANGPRRGDIQQGWKRKGENDADEEMNGEKRARVFYELLSDHEDSVEEVRNGEEKYKVFDGSVMNEDNMQEKSRKKVISGKKMQNGEEKLKAVDKNEDSMHEKSMKKVDSMKKMQNGEKRSDISLESDKAMRDDENLQDKDKMPNGEEKYMNKVNCSKKMQNGGRISIVCLESDEPMRDDENLKHKERMRNSEEKSEVSDGPVTNEDSIQEKSMKKVNCLKKVQNGGKISIVSLDSYEPMKDDENLQDEENKSRMLCDSIQEKSMKKVNCSKKVQNGGKISIVSLDSYEPMKDDENLQDEENKSRMLCDDSNGYNKENMKHRGKECKMSCDFHSKGEEKHHHRAGQFKMSWKTDPTERNGNARESVNEKQKSSSKVAAQEPQLIEDSDESMQNGGMETETSSEFNSYGINPNVNKEDGYSSMLNEADWSDCEIIGSLNNVKLTMASCSMSPSQCDQKADQLHSANGKKKTRDGKLPRANSKSNSKSRRKKSARKGKKSSVEVEELENSTVIVSSYGCDVVDPRSIDVPDADFNDFDKEREVNCFEENQLWAVYDDKEGMPRHYGLIWKVISREPLKVQINWLEQDTNNDQSVRMEINGHFRACGEFVVGNKTTIDCLLFSHLMSNERAVAGIFKIYPRKFSVWAVYKNWSSKWDESTSDETIEQYEPVEIISDFTETLGGSVVPLVKVDGFNYVYRKKETGSKGVQWVKKNEFLKFSHQIPSKRLTGYESKNAPRGCWELDPAALPLVI